MPPRSKSPAKVVTTPSKRVTRGTATPADKVALKKAEEERKNEFVGDSAKKSAGYMKIVLIGVAACMLGFAAYKFFS